VVRGELSERFTDAFDGLVVPCFVGVTAFDGELADQAMLHGLRGRLSDHFASEFGGMTLTTEPGLTVLEGHVRDQAQLYGVIARLCDFGLDLVSVTEGSP
jgi:hypothetical protein